MPLSVDKLINNLRHGFLHMNVIYRISESQRGGLESKLEILVQKIIVRK